MVFVPRAAQCGVKEESGTVLVIVLSLFTLLLTVAVKHIWDIAIVKTVALFLGLEGTVLLASALSPPYDQMTEKPKNVFKVIVWSFTQGRDLGYPINYNPVFFYGGLLFLALSLIVSTVAG